MTVLSINSIKLPLPAKDRNRWMPDLQSPPCTRKLLLILFPGQIDEQNTRFQTILTWDASFLFVILLFKNKREQLSMSIVSCVFYCTSGHCIRPNLVCDGYYRNLIRYQNVTMWVISRWRSKRWMQKTWDCGRVHLSSEMRMLDGEDKHRLYRGEGVTGSASLGPSEGPLLGEVFT